MPLHVDDKRRTSTNGCNGHELNNCLCLEDEYAGTSSSADTSCTLEFFDESSCKINNNDNNNKKETSKKSKRAGKGRRSARCRSPTQVNVFLFCCCFSLYVRVFQTKYCCTRYSLVIITTPTYIMYVLCTS